MVGLLFSFHVGVYSLCDGPRLSNGPYLGVTTVCSVMSLVIVSLKAVFVFSNSSSNVDGKGYGYEYDRASQIALFVCSCALGVGHVVVAYKTSCRERRKLLVYKIDIEAVRVSLPPHFLLGNEQKNREICVFSGELINWKKIAWIFFN